MEIKCKAAVAVGPKQPLQVIEIYVEAPKIGEIRIKVLSNALCHTDVHTLDGFDPEGLFPCILGHEAVGEVESIGEGVQSVAVGDLVIPCYTPECKEQTCIFCNSTKTNLCAKVRNTQGQGLMSDSTSRFRRVDNNQMIYHFMGCSTFSEYTVIHEISAAKLPKIHLDFDRICMLGCGLSTGWGAVVNTTKVHKGSTVVVFGLGAVGLSVIQMASKLQARFIVGVDLNVNKFKVATQFGMHQGVDANSQNLKDQLMALEKWGFDYTFDCTGNTNVMRMALEIAHRGWGQSCVIGVAASGHEISTRPFQLVTGRQWKGTAFGGWKARTDVPKLVKKVLINELNIDLYLTHKESSLEKVNSLIDALHSGECLRGVVQINPYPQLLDYKVQEISSQKMFGGQMKQLKHWSYVNKCEMKFSIYLPSQTDSSKEGVSVLYFLAGLCSTDENGRTKSMLPYFAEQHQIAVIFPDTSPRNIDHCQPDLAADWHIGYSAGFYINSTKSPLSTYFNMYSYINQELPLLCQSLFNINTNNQSIMGFSMGGHGAMISYLKNRSNFKSVSAIAPITHPSNGQIGQKSFNFYFNDPLEGKQYDTYEILDTINDQSDIKNVRILVDFAEFDQFNDLEIQPVPFEKLVKEKGFSGIKCQWNEGYDHSYYLVGSVAQKHVEYHAKYLNRKDE